LIKIDGDLRAGFKQSEKAEKEAVNGCEKEKKKAG